MGEHSQARRRWRRCPGRVGATGSMRTAAGFLLAGDETAIPAIGQLLEWMPLAVAVEVHIEVARRDAELGLPVRGATAITWHHRESGASPGDALVAAVRSSTIAEGWRIWAAGEAAAMYRIRHHLFDERRLPRSRDRAGVLEARPSRRLGHGRRVEPGDGVCTLWAAELRRRGSPRAACIAPSTRPSPRSRPTRNSRAGDGNRTRVLSLGS